MKTEELWEWTQEITNIFTVLLLTMAKTALQLLIVLP